MYNLSYKMGDLFDLPISQFPLSTRCINILKNAGYVDEGSFRNAKESDIKNLPRFGPTLLAELKLFLLGRGIKLQREKKEKKGPKYDPRARDVVKALLPKGEINFSREVPIAGKLLEIYAYEDLLRVKLPSHVSTLAWLYSGRDGWADRFVSSFAPMRLVESEPVVKKQEELPEFIQEYKRVEKPKTLEEFLGLRK